MAGVKGRSGGARPNSGPKPREPQPLKVETPAELTPLDFLLAVMRNPLEDGKLRLEAAKTAAQYMHLKKGDGGIKDEKAEKSKKAAAGRFGAAPPPLKLVNGA